MANPTKRTRHIKPGVLVNEDLAALGPYGYILFTGLWIIADREGRFEWRPKRIKALVMPLWDDAPAATVEKLLTSLWEAGFLCKYEIDGIEYGVVQNWKKHQNPHPREAESELPPPPIDAPVSVRTFNEIQEACPRHVQGMSSDSPRSPRTRTRTIYSGGVGEGGVGEEPNEPSPPPPQPKKTPHRKPPATERRGRESGSLNEKPPEDLGLLRESLDKLAREVRMPPPDDVMLDRIYAAGRGATAVQIHETLVLLWRRNKFRAMRSWAFVPLILSDIFGRERTLSASA
jgi:hypothetical protein